MLLAVALLATAPPAAAQDRCEPGHRLPVTMDLQLGGWPDWTPDATTVLHIRVDQGYSNRNLYGLLYGPTGGGDRIDTRQIGVLLLPETRDGIFHLSVPGALARIVPDLAADGFALQVAELSPDGVLRFNAPVHLADLLPAPGPDPDGDQRGAPPED